MIKNLRMYSLLDKLKEFNKKQIAVIGDVMLDHYIYGGVSRISPEAPVPIVLVNKENFSLGGASNVANNLTVLGAKVTLFGVVNKEDYAGKKIESLNNRINFNFFHDQRKTTVKTRVIAEGQQLIRFDYEDDREIPKKIAEQILTSFRNEIGKFDAIILSDYNKGTLTKKLTEGIIDIANKNDKPVLVDPKPKNIDLFQNCTVLCPNHFEAEAVTKISYNNGKNLRKTAERLSQKINAKYILIKCGKDGIFTYKDKKNNSLIPTYAEEVFDVIGAGDTVLAVLALALASKAGIEEAAKLANYAAGVVVRKVGTSTVTIEEIKEYIKKKNSK